MKSGFKWVSFCLVVYLIFLVVKLPAALVVSKLPLSNKINLNGVSGTIWHGHAQSVQVNGLPIFDVSWELAFLPLLVGNVNADIKAGNIRDVEQISASGFISVSVTGDSLQAESLLAYLPTDLIISLLPLPIPVQADGRFKVKLDDLNYQAGCQELTGNGQWLNANFTGVTGVIDLGSFDADLSCQDGSIIVQVTPPNRFGLTAKASIPANMRFAVEGRFKPEASLPKEVHQAAQFFGKPDAQGYYPIKF